VKAFEMTSLLDKETSFQREMTPFQREEASFQVLSSAPPTYFHPHMTILSPITPRTFTIYSQALLSLGLHLKPRMPKALDYYEILDFD
jgi:hypothetical protein